MHEGRTRTSETSRTGECDVDDWTWATIRNAASVTERCCVVSRECSLFTAAFFFSRNVVRFRNFASLFHEESMSSAGFMRRTASFRMLSIFGILVFCFSQDCAGASELVCKAMGLLSMQCCPIHEFLHFTFGADRAMDCCLRP